MLDPGQVRRHLLPLIESALIDYLRSDVLLHVHLALTTGDAQQGLFVSLSDAVHYRLPLVFQRYCVIIVPVRVRCVH